jgi:hypothetical protein
MMRQCIFVIFLLYINIYIYIHIYIYIYIDGRNPGPLLTIWYKIIDS